MVSIKFGLFITGAIGIASYLSSIMVLCYGFYSLGWEYKRISVEDETSKSEDKK